ncbi:hypothetical protein [Brevibacillus sp. SAFN-007a]|uniref:hypothetical protein n=1 Tax=Brevibacillus sp. SAFN-007a TaxID=3436862 RepID=UPI003F800703
MRGQKRIAFLAGILLVGYVSAFGLPAADANVGDDHDPIKQPEKKVETPEKRLHQREGQLESLESATPRTLPDAPFRYRPALPSSVLPVADILRTGTRIRHQLLVDKPKYSRPAYEDHWHSKLGRWSDLPTRAHYALHRLFAQYDIGLSSWYDFGQQLGLSIPMRQDKQSLDLYIVAFQTKITEVYTKGNQIVVTGLPKKRGVQVITVKTGQLRPANPEENLLIQLVTPDGYELDDTIISYVPPDFSKERAR